MFGLLTDFFLQHRRVSIPYIGRFEIRQEPAKLVFSEKEIHAPAYDIAFSQEDKIDSELVDYISLRQRLDRQTAEDRLKNFGEKLRAYITRKPFQWNGLGELSGRSEVIFRPELIYLKPDPVTAEKVFREKVAHTVLIGDREFQKTTEVVEESPRRRFPALMIIGLTVLVLSLAFIIWRLYLNNWKMPASSWSGY